MTNNTQGLTVKIGDTDMNCAVFGTGAQTLIVLPGLSDGLRTVAKQEKTLARYFRQFARHFRVYVFSRKNALPSGYTTRDMAKDQHIVMEQLGLSGAYVMGVSQGGMIAQYLAIDYPETVKKLVLGVTVSRQTDTVQRVVGSWIAMAQAGDYGQLIADTMEKSFSQKYLRKYRLLLPLISRIGRPKDFGRFLIQARACLTHNAYHELQAIRCPTLVIGGGSDGVVGKNTSEEIAEQINGSKLVSYQALGHGAYDETRDFYQQVSRFLLADQGFQANGPGKEEV